MENQKNLEDLMNEYRDLITARRNLNAQIKKIRDKIKGQYAKEHFKLFWQMLDIDVDEFTEEE